MCETNNSGDERIENWLVGGGQIAGSQKRRLKKYTELESLRRTRQTRARDSQVNCLPAKKHDSDSQSGRERGGDIEDRKSGESDDAKENDRRKQVEAERPRETDTGKEGDNKTIMEKEKGGKEDRV